MLYFDYAANTPVDEDVLAAFCVATNKYFANPNATHPLGRDVHAAMDECSRHILAHFGLQEGYGKNSLIYTSGASEANNLAIKGIAESYRENGKHIISTFLEHSSVSATLTYLQKKGYEIDLLNLLPNGQIDLEQLRDLMRNDTVLVSICAVDSEVGIIQPIQEVADIIRQFPGCFLHVDATQAVGKIKVPYELADCFTFTPHKFYGLNGTGALIKKEQLVLTPLIHGGASTTLYRSGTPVYGQAYAMEKALQLTMEQFDQRVSQMTQVKQTLIGCLLKNPRVQINAPQQSAPHILNISIKGIKAKQIKEELEKDGVCISIKSACAVEATPSRPVMAMTKDRKRALGSFRISLSHETTNEHVEQFMKIFESACGRLEQVR